MEHDPRFPPRHPPTGIPPFVNYMEPGSWENSLRARGLPLDTPRPSSAGPRSRAIVPPSPPTPGVRPPDLGLVAMLRERERIEARRKSLPASTGEALPPPVDPIGDTEYPPAGDYLSRLNAAGGYNRPPTERDVYRQLEGQIDEAATSQRAAMDEHEQGYSTEGRLRLANLRDRGQQLDADIAAKESRSEYLEDALAGRTSEIDKPAPGTRFTPRYWYGDDAVKKAERDAAGAATVRKIKNAEAADKKKRDEEYEAGIQRGIARTSGEFEKNKQIHSRSTPHGPRVDIPEVVWTNPETGKEEVTEASKTYDPRTMKPVPYEDPRTGKPRIRMVRIGKKDVGAGKVTLEGEKKPPAKKGEHRFAEVGEAATVPAGVGQIDGDVTTPSTKELRKGAMEGTDPGSKQEAMAALSVPQGLGDETYVEPEGIGKLTPPLFEEKIAANLLHAPKYGERPDPTLNENVNISLLVPPPEVIYQPPSPGQPAPPETPALLPALTDREIGVELGQISPEELSSGQPGTDSEEIIRYGGSPIMHQQVMNWVDGKPVIDKSVVMPPGGEVVIGPAPGRRIPPGGGYGPAD